ncbi:hypothetical protein [Bosea sp. BK604]|uniref:hypothetical protein n=1 Tax=Bosea sp. BK604 TaxID=2512180 RepID=UPI001047088B|nr:hypothetical protein [Bosea sp. BK604]
MALSAILLMMGYEQDTIHDPRRHQTCAALKRADALLDDSAEESELAEIVAAIDAYIEATRVQPVPSDDLHEFSNEEAGRVKGGIVDSQPEAKAGTKGAASLQVEGLAGGGETLDL